VVALILTVAPDAQLRGMLFWLLGDLGNAGTPWPAMIVLAFGVVVALPYARDLNVMARGELAARSLGVPVSRLRTGIQILASLLTATAVTTTGSVGFVGLVVPHLTRLTIGNDQRLLLPAAALFGGTLLTLADTLARTIAAPVQLPVGALTALIGVPLFLYLLTRRGGPQ
jgi:iron complex transport system permease protein